MKGYCKEPYALIGHVRFCEERKLEVKGGKYRMTKTIIKQQQNAETLVALYIYIYISILLQTSGIRLLDHTYVLVNKTGSVFMPKNSKYYVNEERVY